MRLAVVVRSATSHWSRVDDGYLHSERTANLTVRTERKKDMKSSLGSAPTARNIEANDRSMPVRFATERRALMKCTPVCNVASGAQLGGSRERERERRQRERLRADRRATGVARVG
jgi:hypothetical protein